MCHINSTVVRGDNCVPYWPGKVLFAAPQWPRGLSRRCAAARLLRSWVRIPPGPWMFFCYECCLLSGGGLCDELIARPEESYRLWCVVVCDLEPSWMRRPWPTGGLWQKKKYFRGIKLRPLLQPTKWRGKCVDVAKWSSWETQKAAYGRTFQFFKINFTCHALRHVLVRISGFRKLD